MEMIFSRRHHLEPHLPIQLKVDRVARLSDLRLMTVGSLSIRIGTKRKRPAMDPVAVAIAISDRAIGEAARVLAQKGMTGGTGRNELEDPLTVVRKDLHRQRRISCVFV